MENELFGIEENDLAKYGQCFQRIGRTMGVQDAAILIRDKSGHLFSQGKDEEAKAARIAADLLDSFCVDKESITEQAKNNQRAIWSKVFKTPVAMIKEEQINQQS